MIKTHKTRVKSLKELIASKQKRRKKPATLSKLKRQADLVFSHWVRNRDNHICFTCGKILGSKESQNGHFISRQHTSTRYDERNCNCQCVGCNVFQKGNYPAYAVNLQRKYGDYILKELYDLGKTTVKCDRKFLEEIINKYKL